MNQLIRTAGIYLFMAMTGVIFSQDSDVSTFNEIINQGEYDATVQALEQLKTQLPADDVAGPQLDLALYALQKRDFNAAATSLAPFISDGQYADTPFATQAIFGYATAVAEAGRPGDARSALASLRTHGNPQIVAWAYGAFKGGHLDVDATPEELAAWLQTLAALPTENLDAGRVQQIQRQIAELDETIQGSPSIAARKHYYHELLNYRAAVAEKNWEAVPQELAAAKAAAQQYLAAVPNSETAENANADKRVEAMYQLAVQRLRLSFNRPQPLRQTPLSKAAG